MNKFWFVALNEYKHHVFKKKFLLAIFSLPLLLSVSIGAGYLAERSEDNFEPLGYVDLSGVLANPLPIPEEHLEKDSVELVPFENESQAMQALEDGEIQVYYLVSENFLETKEVTLIYYQNPGYNAVRQFRTLLQVNLSAGLPSEAVNRILEGMEYTVRTPDSSRTFSEANIFSDLVLPLLAGLILMFTLITSAGYLSTAVAEEKENRTIEILATSMSSNQFILGKVVGIVLVVATQMSSWIIFLLGGIAIGKTTLDIEWLSGASLDPGIILLLIGILVPAFFFYAGLTIAISSTATDTSEGQQAMGLVSMPLGFSYWFAGLIISNPNSPFATVLSIFPFTAPTLMPLRAAFSVVPLWQSITCIAVLSVSAVFSIWLAARAYEMGMLRYGKRLRLTELLARNNGKKRVQI
ncbi:MAG: ABC transporter permease [Chloroflexota bacterium]